MTNSEPLDDLEQLIQELQSLDWVERFDAALTLEKHVHQLGKYVATLYQLAADDQSPVKNSAYWLLRELGRTTKELWQNRTGQLVCMECGIPFELRQIVLAESLEYYGCSRCGQSQRFFELKNPKFYLLLDNQMEVVYSQEDEIIRVNWFVSQHVFGFDRVEIIQATDEEVERFAVRVGNEADPSRKSGYQQVACAVATECHLSENTYRILGYLFGGIEGKGD